MEKIMKISLVIPIYYNQDNLRPLYKDIQDKLYPCTEYEWEIVMVNDGSEDGSYQVMRELFRFLRRRLRRKKDEGP